jgi:hypothetical protein
MCSSLTLNFLLNCKKSALCQQHEKHLTEKNYIHCTKRVVESFTHECLLLSAATTAVAAAFMCASLSHSATRNLLFNLLKLNENKKHNAERIESELTQFLLF